MYYHSSLLHTSIDFMPSINIKNIKRQKLKFRTFFLKLPLDTYVVFVKQWYDSIPLIRIERNIIVYSFINILIVLII